jgi:hypothetical protein
MEGDHYIDVEHQTSKLKTVSQQEAINQENESGHVLEPHTESLHKLFQIYASFGEPDNLTTLKSAKLQKMCRDAGLVTNTASAQSVLEQGYVIKQVTRTDIDLIFASICAQRNLELNREQTKESGFKSRNDLNKSHRSSSSFLHTPFRTNFDTQSVMSRAFSPLNSNRS